MAFDEGRGVVVLFGGENRYRAIMGDTWELGGTCGSTCAANFNCDAFVDTQDLFDFLSAFFSVHPDADFNNDGLVDSLDFFDFIAAFLAGC